MRRVLNQAANAAVKAKGTIFAIVYRHLIPRLGHAQAIARSLIGSVVQSGRFFTNSHWPELRNSVSLNLGTIHGISRG
jgi:hypothetical protein